jgi:uncharacterized membrane protein (UPF0127 family)
MRGTVAYSHFCTSSPSFFEIASGWGRLNLLHVTRIEIEGSGEILADNARWARTSKERRKGLIGSPPLESGEGLIIDPAFQVHTFKMNFPIDVVFCDRDWNVRHVVRSLPPRRVTRFVLGARFALELPAGSVPGNLGRGDQVVVVGPGERPENAL